MDLLGNNNNSNNPIFNAKNDNKEIKEDEDYFLNF